MRDINFFDHEKRGKGNSALII
uniref:Uncharacterized protein n=1 Tax=Arundo donax TaxID=35708 RepID=A0A0A9A5U4_ARUDO